MEGKICQQVDWFVWVNADESLGIFGRRQKFQPIPFEPFFPVFPADIDDRVFRRLLNCQLRLALVLHLLSLHLEGSLATFFLQLVDLVSNQCSALKLELLCSFLHFFFQLANDGEGIDVFT